MLSVGLVCLGVCVCVFGAFCVHMWFASFWCVFPSVCLLSSCLAWHACLRVLACACAIVCVHLLWRLYSRVCVVCLCVFVRGFVYDRLCFVRLCFSVFACALRALACVCV